MKFRLWSDLHNEFGSFLKPGNIDDKDMRLLLPGDIDSWGSRKGRCLRKFMKIMGERYKEVLHTAGNHEYYGSSVQRIDRKLRSLTVGDEEFAPIENYVYLQNDTHEIKEDDEHVFVIGATLWTDFQDADHVKMMLASQLMNDYRYIRWGKDFGKFRPNHALGMHYKSRTYIEDEMKRIRKDHTEAKIVVMTHHAPCSLSIHEQYKGSEYNHLYYSDLSEMILDHKPNVWIHGHVHNSFNYEIGETRVIVNPRGYTPNDLNPEFVDDLTFEV